VFYVSVSQTALDKIINHAKSKEEEEVAGLLIGKLVGQTIVIEDAVTGRIEASPTGVVLPPETIAKIADDILEQRIQGNVVGWYHSHLGYGIFMSKTDIEAQKRLQQFSPYITALIVDPVRDEIGFFTLSGSGTPVTIPQNRIYVFPEGMNPVPAEHNTPIEPAHELIGPVLPEPLYEEASVPPVHVARKRRTGFYLTISIFLVGVLVGAAFVAGFLYREQIQQILPKPNFALSVLPTKQQILVGQAASFTVSVTPNPAFATGNLTLKASCANASAFKFDFDLGESGIRLQQSTPKDIKLTITALQDACGPNQVKVSAKAENITQAAMIDVRVPELTINGTRRASGPLSSSLHVQKSRSLDCSFKVVFRSSFGDIGKVRWNVTRPPDVSYDCKPSQEWISLKEVEEWSVIFFLRISRDTRPGNYTVAITIHPEYINWISLGGININLWVSG
jgi:proteasome lid subunit RPN8/RPN11